MIYINRCSYLLSHKMLNFYLSILISLSSTSVYSLEFKSVADQHIIAGYDQLVLTTKSLQASAFEYCSKTNENNLAQLKNNYQVAFYAWQSVQHIRFGPIQYLLRDHRFQLWPDKRGNVNKHMLRLLADSTVLQGIMISKKSIAVQGFGALEYLLFSKIPIDSNRCKLANIIAENLRVMSVNTLANWQDGEDAYRDDFISPGRNSDIYDSDEELSNELFNSLYTQLEFLQTQKLARPLGESLEKSRGKRAEGWRSETSKQAIRINLTVLQELYILVLQPEIKDKVLDNKVLFAFKESQRLIDRVNLSIRDAVTNPVERIQLEKLQVQIMELQKIFSMEIAYELGLSIGFNSLDGD